MMVEPNDQEAPSSRPAPSSRRERAILSVRSSSLQRSQRLHAGAIQILPLLGTALAVTRALRHGVTALELSLLAVFYLLTMLGMTVGLHRMLSHLAFTAHPAVRAALTVLGAMAVQGPPIYWVANHRRHHQFSDEPGDPHSPRFEGVHEIKGLGAFWHAHVGWMFDHELTNVLYYCRDLLRDPIVSFISKRYYVWVALGLALPALINGLATRSLDGALGGLLWGGLVRIFLSCQATSCINSVTHVYGSREFNTTDTSRNTRWLAIPTLGEAWHNNHHAFPASAIFGFRAGQIDLGGYVIRGLERMSLARKVNRAAQIEQRPGWSGDEEPTTQRSPVLKQHLDPVTAPPLLSKGGVR